MTDVFYFGAHQEAAERILAHIKRGQHVLLTGLTGAGKTYLAKLVLASKDAPEDAYMRAPELITAETGEPERRLARLLLDDESTSLVSSSSLSDLPQVLVIDMVEIVAGFPPRDSVAGQEVEHRLASIFRYCLDHTKKAIIAISNRPEAIGREFRRAGRLLNTVNVSLSKPNQRATLLKEVLPNGMLTDDQLQYIANNFTHGYSAADLHHLVSMSLMYKLQTKAAVTSLTVADFEKAASGICPSVTANLPLASKHISSSDNRPLVGFDEIRSKIMHLILDPLERAPLYARYRVTPTRGILLHGPSGSGKTALALRCAQESGLTVIHVQATAIRSKYVGQSEKNLVEYFRRARQCAPSILFLDHLEALFPERSPEGADSSASSRPQEGSQRLITCLLNELDGLKSRQSGDGVFILAATSYPEIIDAAVLRPGRIGVHLSMPSFNADLRRSFLGTTSVPLELTNEQTEELIKLTDGLSAADMDGLLREAALLTIRERGELVLKSSHVPYEAVLRTLRGGRTAC